MQPAEKNAPSETAAPDTHIGQRLRMRRLMMGLTQEKLADMLGITFQQIQKYERGLNKLSAARLHELSILMRVPLNYFFEEMPAYPMPGLAEVQEKLEETPTPDMSSRETMDLLRAYYRIEDDTKRRRVLDLIRAMADE